MSMQAIQNPREHREHLFKKLYLETFPRVAAFISRRGGSLDQAKDLFQEALVIYYEQVVIAQRPIRQNAAAYLLGTIRHLWLQQQKGTVKHQSIDQLEATLTESPDQNTAQKLLHVLETAGKRCMDMLRAFYYEQEPLGQIAGRFGFGSIRSATVQKYKCLEKVRNTVKEKELTYADFTE